MNCVCRNHPMLRRSWMEGYPDGIPKEEFENLIMEYLPVSAEQIREWAVCDMVMYNEKMIPHELTAA